jgi:hypothetical protein
VQAITAVPCSPALFLQARLLTLSGVDIVIIALYFITVLGIGFYLGAVIFWAGLVAVAFVILQVIFW